MEGDKEDMLRQERAGDGPSQTTWYIGEKKKQKNTGRRASLHKEGNSL